ncbi:MAG: hypothetical protein WD181_02875 [Solirubrobacterales bacterium]
MDRVESGPEFVKGRWVYLAMGLALAAVSVLLLSVPSAARAVLPPETVILPNGVERTTYYIGERTNRVDGPLKVTSGQNRIDYDPIFGLQRPSENGWITRIKPNMVRPDGSIPLSSEVMFHHGVWLNANRNDATDDSVGSAFPERFYATGEEKTAMNLPPGFGYRYLTTDFWTLNHMIHNLVPQAMELYITYTIDFIPDDSPLAEGIEPVRPIWMDVENGSYYPVFDVKRGSGGRDGKFTYPADAGDPYGSGPTRNEWTVDRDGVLVHTTGHVHTGGLSTELYLKRDGARYAGPRCQELKRLTRQQNRNWSSQRKRRFEATQKRARACRAARPSVNGNRVELFTSKANYFDNRPPVSWDVAMFSTRPDWRVEVKAGDTLELQTTYETKIASWYESMGLQVVYMADDEVAGKNPYRKRVNYPGAINHGQLEENSDHGGTGPVVGPDPSELPSGLLASDPLMIGGYSYEAGDFRLPGELGRPPVVERGEQITFQLSSSDQANAIWHSLTSCKSPCNKSTGISYPIADGAFQFDSGQLGIGDAPTVNRSTWSTPRYMPVGTHTFFCRIHPLMRGAVRVVEPR